LAFFPGPFDDFEGRPRPDPVPEAFEGVVTQMQSAASFRDMAALFALAYTIRLPEGVLADVERLLDRAPDEPLVGDHERPFLHLCAHIAGAARSETIGKLVFTGACMRRGRRNHPKKWRRYLELLSKHAP